jgi:hypothetical protein
MSGFGRKTVAELRARANLERATMTRLPFAIEDAERAVERLKQQLLHAKAEFAHAKTMLGEPIDPPDSENSKARYAKVKPAVSRWSDGWLIHMTTIGGWVMVQYPGDRPFVLSRDEWNDLPDRGPWVD